MPPKRTYGDRCGIARALDLIGERWALLVVRELLLGPKRFTDLRAGLPHIGPDVLSQRLRELEQAGILRRGKLPPPAGSRIYERTPRGRELEPVVLALGRWGSRGPLPYEGGRATGRGDAVFGADSVVLALKTLFTPSATPNIRASYELCLGDQCFRANIKDGQLELCRGRADAANAVIETDPLTLSGVLWHGGSLADAIASGEIKVRGSAAAAEWFLTLFPLPS